VARALEAELGAGGQLYAAVGAPERFGGRLTTPTHCPNFQ
jgi:hypothetical protein